MHVDYYSLTALGSPAADAASPTEVARRRHKEWTEYSLHWRFLLDSFEGGRTYTEAVYGYDRLGFPVRNLLRHKFEYPDPKMTYGNRQGFNGPPPYPGADPSQWASDSDYELRRARTPVPDFVKQCVECHTSKIFGKEVTRKGPPALAEWWDDVDGRGAKIKEWMEQTIAPLLLVLGQLDVGVDHPPAPAGARVDSQADVKRLKLDVCRAYYILPENMCWWRLNPDGAYAECMVREFADDPNGNPVEYYRVWDTRQSQLYDDQNRPVGPPVPHPYGRVPIRRVFDRRRTRTNNIGQSRYEDIAFKQREYYNRDSELVLSDTNQVHCIIQGPELGGGESTVPIGPGWMLEKHKDVSGGTVHYEGYEVVEFPKDGAESLRKNMGMIKDDVHGSAKMTKPAGTTGQTGQVVSQSGISKALDNREGNYMLSQITGTLEKAERVICELVLMCYANGPPDPKAVAAVEIVYPQSFDLMTLAELADGCTQFQALLAASGSAPETEKLILQKIVQELLPGLNGKTYETLFAEIDRAVDAKAAGRRQLAEGAAPFGGLPADPRFIGQGGLMPPVPAPGTAAGGAAPSPQADPIGRDGFAPAAPFLS